jgi:hypothetical protein
MLAELSISNLKIFRGLYPPTPVKGEGIGRTEGERRELGIRTGVREWYGMGKEKKERS